MVGSDQEPDAVAAVDSGSGQKPATSGTAPALRYTCNQYTTLPVIIPGDSRRELLGIYLISGSDPLLCSPLLGGGTAGIYLSQYVPNIELRNSTHGPLARDVWTVDHFGPAIAAVSGVTVMTVVPEG